MSRLGVLVGGLVLLAVSVFFITFPPSGPVEGGIATAKVGNDSKVKLEVAFTVPSDSPDVVPETPMSLSP